MVWMLESIVVPVWVWNYTWPSQFSLTFHEYLFHSIGYFGIYMFLFFFYLGCKPLKSRYVFFKIGTCFFSYLKRNACLLSDTWEIKISKMKPPVKMMVHNLLTIYRDLKVIIYTYSHAHIYMKQSHKLIIKWTISILLYLPKSTHISFCIIKYHQHHHL